MTKAESTLPSSLSSEEVTGLLFTNARHVGLGLSPDDMRFFVGTLVLYTN